MSPTKQVAYIRNTILKQQHDIQTLRNIWRFNLQLVWFKLTETAHGFVLGHCKASLFCVSLGGQIFAKKPTQFLLCEMINPHSFEGNWNHADYFCMGFTLSFEPKLYFAIAIGTNYSRFNSLVDNFSYSIRF